MKKMLQNFGNILSVLFVIDYYLQLGSEFGRIS